MGAFDDLIPAKKSSTGAFDDLIPAQQVAPAQLQQEVQAQHQGLEQDIFSGLPQETIKMIEERHPLRRTAPSPAAVGMAVGGLQPREILDPESEKEILKARDIDAQLERIRIENPALAQQIEETGGMDAFLVGAGRGLTTIGRAVGLAEPEDPTVKQALDIAGKKSAALGGGEIVGESAPFLALSPLAALPRTVAGRVAATSALTGSEGAAIAKGKGAKGADVVKAGLLSGALGGAAELAAPIARSVSNLVDASKAGRNMLKTPTKKEIAKGVAEAAPTSSQLREASREIYKGVEELQIKINPKAINDFSQEIIKDAQQVGFRDTPAARGLLGETSKMLDLIEETFQGSVGVEDIEFLRRAAQGSASKAVKENKQDAAIINSIVDNVDDFLSTIDTKKLSGEAANIGRELATARKLWGRARKSELLDDAVKSADLQASGLENGIRIKFRQILNNKKQSRFFNASELAAMRNVVEGSTGGNFFKMLGKTGFGRGQQTNVLGGTAALGVSSTLVNPIFGALLAGAGQVSKNLAENLTKNNAAMANLIIRAGDNADKIAKIYLSRTPKSAQNVDDLTSLLMRGDIDLEKAVQPIAIEAAEKARQLRLAPAAAVGVAAAPVAAEEK